MTFKYQDKHTEMNPVGYFHQFLFILVLDTSSDHFNISFSNSSFILTFLIYPALGIIPLIY